MERRGRGAGKTHRYTCMQGSCGTSIPYAYGWKTLTKILANQIQQQHVKRIIHYDQIGLFPQNARLIQHMKIIYCFTMFKITILHCWNMCLVFQLSSMFFLKWAKLILFMSYIFTICSTFLSASSYSFLMKFHPNYIWILLNLVEVTWFHRMVYTAYLYR